MAQTGCLDGISHLFTAVLTAGVALEVWREGEGESEEEGEGEGKGGGGGEGQGGRGNGEQEGEEMGRGEGEGRGREGHMSYKYIAQCEGVVRALFIIIKGEQHSHQYSFKVARFSLIAIDQLMK